MNWVSPSYAAHEARKAGFKHSHEDAIRIMRAHGHFKDKIKRRSDHRDLVDLDAYLEVAKYISTEREKRKQQAADARQQVEEGRLAELEREIKAARKWAADADIERQAALTECDRLRRDYGCICSEMRRMMEERDEARRMICRLDADTMEDQIEYAAHRGWDCFKEER